MVAVRHKMIQTIPQRRPLVRAIGGKDQGKEKIIEFFSLPLQKWKPIAYCFTGLLLILGTYAFIHSSVFALTTIEISGQERLKSFELERIVRQNVSGSLLTVSLSEIEHNLESLTWVKSAQVTRVLPDMVRVKVEERKPLLLARLEGQVDLVWLDEEGIILGSYEPSRDKDLPPIAIGFASDRSENAKSENLERIENYKKFIWALDSGEPKYSKRLECIDFNHPQSISVQLEESNIVINLGGEDYRGRLVQAIRVLDALKSQDAATIERLHLTDPRILRDVDKINFVSVVNPGQISLGFNSVDKAPLYVPNKTEESMVHLSKDQKRK